MFRLAFSPATMLTGRCLRPSSLALQTLGSSSPSLGSQNFQTSLNRHGKVRLHFTKSQHTGSAATPIAAHPTNPCFRSWYRTSNPLLSAESTEEKKENPKEVSKKEDPIPKETTSPFFTKKEDIPTAAAVATAAAVVPILLGAAGILYYPPINFQLAQHITSMQLTYGTMFISFFASSHFAFAASNYQIAPPGAASLPKGSSRALQYALGIVPPLVTWSLLFLSPIYSYTSLLGATTALFLGDLHFWKKGMVPIWWVKMRYRATMAVLVGLGASFMMVQK